MNIYVGNISYNTSEQALREHFASLGTVEDVRIINDRATGRSKGFGFVTFTNDDEARTAIAELNGVELDGRELVVNEARERKPRY